MAEASDNREETNKAKEKEPSPGEEDSQDDSESAAESESEEDEEDVEDDEPKLKYARLTGHLGPVYRNGDATSAFLVAGDKMVGLGQTAWTVVTC
jgi:hypothetical protein